MNYQQPKRLKGTLPQWPPADEEVRVALEATLRDGSWGHYHGRHSEALVDNLSAQFDSKYVVLASSGTIAVEMALRGVGVKAGDEVLLAGYDFPGNFRSIEAIGAYPVLVDIDPVNWCLNLQALESLAKDAGKSSSKVRAVVISHLHGGLAPMQKITELARRHRWAVVEDTCQAPGARVDGRAAGSWGDVGVLSFGGSKLLTAGRGGALLTNHQSVMQRAKIFAERGNNAFPLSELQAAVLNPQLSKLASRNLKRREAAALLVNLVRQKVDHLVPLEHQGNDQPVFYKVAWRYQSTDPGAVTRAELVAACQARGIPIDTGFRGFVERTKRRCRKVSELPHSRAAAQGTLLLHHPVLLQEEEEIRQVANNLGEVCQILAT
jgi:perosamine synthetase